MDNEVNLKVALGLEEAPSEFNYSVFESIEDVDFKADVVVKKPMPVVNLSNIDPEADCVIVAVFEKGSVNEATPIQQNVINGPDVPLKEAEKQEIYVDKTDFELKDAKAVEGDVDKKEIPLNEAKGEEGCDVDKKEVPLKEPNGEKGGEIDKKEVPLKEAKGEEDDDADTKVFPLKEPKGEEGGEVDKKEVPFKEPKEEEGDVDKKEVPLKEPKKEESNVDKKECKTEFGGDDPNVNGRIFAARRCFDLEEKLKIGTEFADLEKVYLLYCEYARHKGFSVRKGEQRYFGKSSTIRWKEFICSSTGFPNYRSTKHKLAVYKKLVVRTNCKARITVSRDDFGSFVVASFDTEHNHTLVDCDQTFLLRSSRQMSYAKKSVLEALNSAGIGVTAAFNFMAKECGGVQNVGFTKKDAYHHMDRVRLQTRVEDGDARLLLEHFSNKSNKDPYFFCKYQLDDDGRLMNVFFRDNRCAVDYDAFGDVLSVDTTYRTNKYNMICAPFVGINHHTRNVMFGMAMLSDETTGTFKWLFETFLQSMHGKQPKVIFTDQCRAMMNAIDVTFPNSKHRLCQWHIQKNCASNFGKLQGDSKFKGLWYKCMNVVETEKEFETTWKEMMGNYEIANQSWFDGMYNLRQRWASCFSRGIFTAGLLATSRSESTNKALKDVVRHTIALSQFVIHYEEILTNWRSIERAEDTFGIWQPGQAITHSGLLKKAARVFTSTIYKQFEHDLANCITVVLDVKAAIPLPNNNIQYIAISPENPSFERKVVFNSVTHVCTCDCGKWETEGLICRHILLVFVIENVTEFPDCMIYRRWTKRAKDLTILAQENVGEESAIMRNMTYGNEFMRHMSELVSTGMQHEPLRLKLVQRMKEVTEEFQNMIWNYVAAEAPKNAPPPPSVLVVPLFRDPRKICPRGFANVRKANPFESKGRKRAPRSTPKASPAKKAKVNPKSPQTTQDFMSSKEEKMEKENAGTSTPDDMDFFFDLSL